MRQLIPILLIGLVIASGCGKSPEEARQQKIKEALFQRRGQEQITQEDAIKILRELKAIPVIIKLLRDTDPDVRLRAVNALGCLDAKEAISEIVMLLQDNDFYVRRTTVWTLAHLNAKESIPEITKLLQNKEPSIRDTARMVLYALGAELPEEKQGGDKK